MKKRNTDNNSRFLYLLSSKKCITVSEFKITGIISQFFAIILILLTPSVIKSQISISSDGSKPDPSAMLDVKSSSKGLLIPRVNDTSDVTIKSDGLLVYKNSGGKGFYYFDSEKGWIALQPKVTFDAANNICNNNSKGNTRYNIPDNRLEVCTGTEWEVIGSHIDTLVVEGELKLGNTDKTCDASTEGSLRYNSGKMEICSGSSWSEVGVGSGGSTTLAGLTDSDITTPNSNSLLRYNSTSSKWEDTDINDALGVTSVVPGWPDAIICDDGTNFSLFRHDTKVGNVHYYLKADGGGTVKIRFNSDGSFLDNIGGGLGTTVCNNKSISTLKQEGRTFNYIGNGSSLGESMVSGWPDVIKCTFGTGHTFLYLTYNKAWTGNKMWYRQINYSDHYGLSFTLDKNYSSNNLLSTSDCISRSISTLYKEGKAFNILGGGSGASSFRELTDATISETPANNSLLRYNSTSGKWENTELNSAMGATSIVPGWPDALNCGSWILLPHAIGANSASYEMNYTNDGTDRRMITFSSITSTGVITGANFPSVCSGKTIQDLYDEGRAFNFIGSQTSLTNQQYFTTPGNHTFTVPPGVTQIRVTVAGAGGSGGLYHNGGDGGESSVSNMTLAVNIVAYGGKGAQSVSGCGSCGASASSGLSHLSGSGGDFHILGGGAAGGMSGSFHHSTTNWQPTGMEGNPGGLSIKLISNLNGGESFNIIVGEGGVQPTNYYDKSGAKGADGWVKIEWGGAGGGSGNGAATWNHTATQNITMGSNYLSGDGSNEGIFVDSDGKVGIGTNTPTTPLHIKDIINTTIARVENTSTGASGIEFLGQNKRWIIVKKGKSEDYKLRVSHYDGSAYNPALTLDTLSNMGVGNMSPKTKLDVNGAVKLGTTSKPCDADRKGAIQYNFTDNVIESCDGANWVKINLAGMNDTDIPETPAQNSLLRYSTSKSKWEAAELNSAMGNTSMLNGWPDVIKCSTGAVDRYMYLRDYYSGNVYYQLVFASTNHIIWYNETTKVISGSTNMDGYDCITPGETIQNLYDEGKAFNIIGKDNSLIGEVKSYAGDTLELSAGWKVCRGQKMSKTTYPSLFRVLKYSWGGSGDDFHLPDLRGQFLRGVDINAGKDPNAVSRTDISGTTVGGVVGSYQEDEFKNHNHPSSAKGSAGNDRVGTGNFQVAIGGSTTGSKGGSETRPKNAYVYFIIKVNN